LRDVRGVDRSPIPGIVTLPAAAERTLSLPLSATNQSWLPTCFLKSRVYAKLLTGLFLKHYQTFNGHPACCWMETPEYRSLRNRQTDEPLCNRL